MTDHSVYEALEGISERIGDFADEAFEGVASVKERDLDLLRDGINAVYAALKLEGRIVPPEGRSAYDAICNGGCLMVERKA